ncbi:hypothetical protein [Alcaligenes sp. PF14]|uniref:hypothetical protein n=1 Tax=Alcaligenes sp. PF14 TaxID=3120297 RepID=UPI00301668B8
MLFSTGRGTSKQSENHAAMNCLQKEAWIADELYLGRSNPSFQKLFQFSSHQLLLFSAKYCSVAEHGAWQRKSRPQVGFLHQLHRFQRGAGLT